MKKLIIILLLFCGPTVFSQDKNTEGDVIDLFKITLLNPGISYEKRIGKFQTIFLQAFMNLSATKNSIFGSETYEYFFDPALTAQYRYYYNYGRRNDKGLRTSMNNLNYFSPVYQVFFSKIPFSYYTVPVRRRPVHAVAAVWGMQRNYNKLRFALDLNIGPGLLFASTKYSEYQGGPEKTISQSQFTLYGQLNIGFWLNKSKSSE